MILRRIGFTAWQKGRFHRLISLSLAATLAAFTGPRFALIGRGGGGFVLFTYLRTSQCRCTASISLQFAQRSLRLEAYFFLNKSSGFTFGAVFLEGWLLVAGF